MRSTIDTVKITLSEPNASLPMTLGNKYGAVVPAGYFDAADAKPEAEPDERRHRAVQARRVQAEQQPDAGAAIPTTGRRARPISTGQLRLVPNSASMLVGLTNKRSRPRPPQRVRRTCDRSRKSPGLVDERWPSLNQKAIDLGSELRRRSTTRACAGDRARRRQGRDHARLDRWPRTSNRHDGRRDAGPLGAAPRRAAQPEAGRRRRRRSSSPRPATRAASS